MNRREPTWIPPVGAPMQILCVKQSAFVDFGICSESSERSRTRAWHQYLTAAVVSAALTILASAPAYAHWVGIDLHKKLDSHAYFVVFMAYGPRFKPFSAAGHTFVVFGEENPDLQMSTIDAWGFYPEDEGSANAVKSIFVSVPGTLENQLTKTSPDGKTALMEADEVFAVRLDSSNYSVTRMTRTGYKAAHPGYKIAASDCVTFVEKIASGAGLNVPQRTILNSIPLQYVKLFRLSCG